ncbi:type II restriction endonuclease [Mycoplasma seminis]|uniref:Type-2 restriction enzyme n=1 Tax=Mycoplasma seminis TaxID=512749 RepID=A0ABY9HAN5_9MOLU|nr:type II restriction endonuclease [Mycoplasma seminis]WLP85321.1 type II restriction endonuclease [Mycoplasma seminis]
MKELKMLKIRNFEEWISRFRESIADYKYYVDFDTVYQNVHKAKIELQLLNQLIGADNVKEKFEQLCLDSPEVIDAIPLLLAKRENEIWCMDENGQYNYSFNSKLLLKTLSNVEFKQYVKQLSYFMEQTGLFTLIKKHLINNLFDYAIGVEVGLNANARKNRGGALMEGIVESYLIKAGYIRNNTYFKEIYLSDLEKLTGLNLSSISNQGKTKKRFDFAIIDSRNNQVYAIECNFYASSGSKLNETARSYKNIALSAADIPNFHFMWITDGKGWYDARNNLQETFEALEHMYSIDDLENGILEKL